MGQIEDLRVFVDVVNNNGIARAGEALNIAKSAVSRRLKLMEERYGTQLIDRRPGVWEVTTAGQELYQRAVRVLAEADEIEADFTDIRQSLAGPLSVSLPHEFGLAFLQPALLRFIARHPEIQLTVDFDDRRVDLERENYDLAIRVSETSEPGLVTRRLGGSRHQLYASANYAKIAPLPATLDALTLHPLLHFGPARRARWEFQTNTGKQTVEFQPVLNSNSGIFLLEATIHGMGIARMPDFIAADSHAKGDLLLVLPDVTVADRNINLVYSENRMVNRRMRAFFEEISLACSAL